MIKFIIFDMDGVLIEAKELHFESLNRAICEVNSSYAISKEDHLSKYDGLPTKEKLLQLNKEKGLSKEFFDKIWSSKQGHTFQAIKDLVSIDKEKTETLRKLKLLGYKIYVASNSIYETIKLILMKTGLLEYVDKFISNEDVKNPKPHPEIYLRCMIDAGFKPDETLVLEDSVPGRAAATSSAAHLLPINSINEVNFENIIKKIEEIDKNKSSKKSSWDGTTNLNVLIPLAGAGSRFANAGYTFPKPIIDICGKPMIQRVVENLNIKANYIYIIQKEHFEKYNLHHLLNLITPNCSIIQVDGLTEGAACTTMLAKEFIDNDKQLLIANSDQLVEWDASEFMYKMSGNERNKPDGGILTFESTHPKWSFVKVNDDGNVIELAEKKPISNCATVGIYFWQRGSDYVKYAESMISKNIRVNNEFYTAPVYNEAIQDGMKIKIHQVEKMWGIGTPEDLNYFLQNINNAKV